MVTWLSGCGGISRCGVGSARSPSIIGAGIRDPRAGWRGEPIIVKPDVIPGAVSRGVLGRGCAIAEYYTTQPAPTQWLAIGVVSIHSDDPSGSRMKQLLVGAGRTESAAVGSLWDRLTTLALAQPAAAALSSPVPDAGFESWLSDDPEGKPFPRLVPAEPAFNLG